MKRFLTILAFAISSLGFVQSAYATTTTPTSPAGGNSTFVPLTQFPQIQALSQPSNFATFVNTFYKILIGAGAVLAVLVIMYAGVQVMMNRGSVTKPSEARTRIQNAVLGLILLLSPVIVFGIINPSILNLNLGGEFSQLQSKPINQAAFQSPSSTPAGGSNTCSLPANTVQVVQGDMCPTGSQPIGYGSADYGCCSSQGIGNICCKKTSGNANKYLLAYYYTRTNNSTNYSCYITGKGSYATQTECNSAKTNVPKSIGSPQPGITQSSITYVNSCELGDPASVSIPVPNNLPRCPG